MRNSKLCYVTYHDKLYTYVRLFNRLLIYTGGTYTYCIYILYIFSYYKEVIVITNNYTCRFIRFMHAK